MYRFLKEGVPMEEAKQQRPSRYGHFRQADTGILTAESYLEY